LDEWVLRVGGVLEGRKGTSNEIHDTHHMTHGHTLTPSIMTLGLLLDLFTISCSSSELSMEPAIEGMHSRAARATVK